eukprot:4827480-Pleurochrysis_carterae.AAC.1
MGALGHGGWARLRRSPVRGRRGQRGRPCARRLENPEAQKARVRQTHMRCKRKNGKLCACETLMKWGATAFAEMYVARGSK